MISDHDKDRIIEAASQFYEMLSEESDLDVVDVTLDHVLIIGLINMTLSDEREIEVPVLFSTTRRVYAQRGIIETMLERMRASVIYNGGHDEDTE